MRRMGAFWQGSAALGLSAAIHFTVMALNTERPVIIQATGDSDMLVQAFGNSFADLAIGIETPEPVIDAPIAPTPPVESTPDPIDPTVIDQVDPPAAEQPSETDTTQPSAPTPPEATDDASSTDVLAAEIATQSPTETETAESPPVENAVQPVETEIASVMTPEQTSTLAALAPAEPTDIVESEEIAAVPPPVAIDRVRAEAQAARQRARERERRRIEEAARRPPASLPPPGNADVNTQRGESDQPARPEPAQTPRTGPTQAPPNPGNSAAISNYPGQVHRRIQRVRNRQVAGVGMVVVDLLIAQNGSLSSVRLAASSGSAELDQAALDKVRRAAPFPRPPAGARRDYTVRIDFR